MPEIKAIEIARKLGISKATVSLALNNKPGVSQETRQKVLNCKQQMQLAASQQQPAKQLHKQQIIKILVPSKHRKTVRYAELDLWTDVNAVFDRMAKTWGYTLGLSYLDMSTVSAQEISVECSAENIAGVILFATELDPPDIAYFADIQKPMVIYDCDMQTQKFSSVLVNNRLGIQNAVTRLLQAGCKNIFYLANSIDIYNYRERREGFCESMKANGIADSKQKILTMGDNIDDIYRNMKAWLTNHTLPDAFIMESYHLSIGTIRALHERKIQIPRDISLIGVDKLPQYMTGECQLTTIHIPHTERAALTMVLLHREILHNSSFKSKVFTNCLLVEGNTVASPQERTYKKEAGNLPFPASLCVPSGQ